MVAAYGWPIDYVLDLTVPQIRLLLRYKQTRERVSLLWQTHIAASAMFAMSPKQGAEYLDHIRALITGEDDGSGWHVPSYIPRLESMGADTKTAHGLPIPVHEIKPEDGEEVTP